MLRASKIWGTAALLFWLGACGAAAATASKVNAQENACQHYVSVLQADHAAGLSCPAAKAHAEAVEPDCKLVFTCKE